MDLSEVKIGDIIQIKEIRISRRIFERFKSINVNIGQTFIVKKVLKDRYIELCSYNKKEEKNENKGFFVISKFYFDKIEVDLIKNKI
ncbi:MAG TPA: hypothetical protein PLF21_01850 [Exilispira sp.]|nr:hypothetical protein [Exilispira sp.]